MQTPRKHYFNQAFSLKPWTGSSETVCQMRRIGDNVVARRIHPYAAGWTKTLYRMAGVRSEQGQALELDYFRTLDIEADRALQLLLNPNPSRLDSTMRVAWARYVVSLNSRAPKEVSELAEQIAEMSKREVAFRREPATPQLAPEQMLIRCTDSDGVASKILKMQWSCVRLFESDIELLSTDRPVIWPVSLDRPEAYMVLPIAPQLLFVAANSKQTILFYAGMQHKHLIKSINKITVGQARQFVWASNDKELDFVEKYLLGGSETNFVRTE
jgi:hypothetical protein